jgi:hypothetical protein
MEWLKHVKHCSCSMHAAIFATRVRKTRILHELNFRMAAGTFVAVRLERFLTRHLQVFAKKTKMPRAVTAADYVAAEQN